MSLSKVFLAFYIINDINPPKGSQSNVNLNRSPKKQINAFRKFFNDVETLEILVKTAHVLHSQKSLVEDLFTGQKVAANDIYLKMQNACSVQHYMMNTLLYLCTFKEEYIAVCNEFITQLCIFTKAVGILVKGYLPIL